MKTPSFNAVAVTVEKRETTLEDLISRGMELREKKDNISWELGDLAIEVTRLFGPRYLPEFSKGIGIIVSTIRRYRDISKTYSPEMREKYSFCSWSHFRQVAAREDRLEWLERACDEQWSLEKLTVMTKKDQSGVIDDGLPVPPMPEMELCLGCRRWHPVDPSQLCPSGGQCPDIHK